MVQIIERVQAHYEAREVPFGITYEWHPAYVALECDCGKKVTLSATSTITTCRRCGAYLAPFGHGDDSSQSEAARTHEWREVGVGAQILRDLGVSSIRNMATSSRSFVGLSGFGIEILGNEPLDT